MAGFDDHLSGANRQDLPFVHEEQRYIEAQARQQQHCEEVQAALRAGEPPPGLDEPYDPQSPENRDWSVICAHDDHAGSLGASTFERGQVISRKGT